MKPGTFTKDIYCDIPDMPLVPRSTVPPPASKPEDLNDVFKRVSSDLRGKVEKFKPAFAAFSSVISQLRQELGLTGIGFTLATQESLKEINLFDGNSWEKGGTAAYAILDIYGKKFLACFEAPDIVSFYNSPLMPANIGSLPSVEKYSLTSNNDDRARLTTSLIWEAAAHIEAGPLRDFDMPVEKPSQKQPIKHAIPTK